MITLIEFLSKSRLISLAYLGAGGSPPATQAIQGWKAWALVTVSVQVANGGASQPGTLLTLEDSNQVVWRVESPFLPAVGTSPATTFSLFTQALQGVSGATNICPLPFYIMEQDGDVSVAVSGGAGGDIPQLVSLQYLAM